MLTLLGYALILVAFVAVLFVLAVFQAAAIEVRQRKPVTLLTLKDEPAPERPQPDHELPRAA